MLAFLHTEVMMIRIRATLSTVILLLLAACASPTPAQTPFGVPADIHQYVEVQRLNKDVAPMQIIWAKQLAVLSDSQALGITEAWCIDINWGSSDTAVRLPISAIVYRQGTLKHDLASTERHNCAERTSY
jgi:hypothetical protein